MNNDRKRSYIDDQSPDPNKKLHRSNPQQQPQSNRLPVFASYLEVPNLLPQTKQLCEIVSNTPSLTIERVLDEASIRVSQEIVEEVLKLSYAYPGSAVKFFRWSASQLNGRHSPYAWNLVVDFLGKNTLFDAMWDAIRSMKREGLLSLATFASVFSSYAVHGRVHDAIRAFEVMEQYGCRQDIVALNSLLSAICREGTAVDAVDFLQVVKVRIRPDADSYAILLEGLENEGNVVGSRQTFAEMVAEIGWDPRNVPAYDSFLSTLLKGRGGIHEVLNSFKMLSDRRCYPGIKFFKLALEECLKTNDVRGAELIWESMVGGVPFKPDAQMYNSMITLHCYSNNTDEAIKLLDEMVYSGVFPDVHTYNVLFQFLIKARKLREASVLFKEMVKNEFVPSQENCHAAVRIYIGTGDPDMAIKVWKCMFENYHLNLADTGNILVHGLCDMDMLPEAVKYAEGMIEKGIKLTSTSLSKLKQSFTKAGKVSTYDELMRNKASSS
ncbi:hypothetical protein LWI29_014985 [Acer saccharum]|uniref:Pentatricopeptide repeat-containing protein n=1 Tax=Acer saccharum TaxID=4024 RepID=A0AA39SS82_ACESA|nr:hypothetical protein LWI29_012607 [Acer saccharum]KAK0596367.1 hypothetical protein LWI29_014985 [Acer saccharum]